MQTKLKSALYVVLVMIAGFFSSCDNSNEPEIQVQDEAVIPSVSAPKMRSSSGTYTVQQKYKDSYSHYTSWHNIAPGFVSWWNCIAKAEHAGTITVADIIKLGKGKNKIIHLSTLKDAYQGLSLKGYQDEDEFITAEEKFKIRLQNLDNNQPFAVLINNNYNGNWKNVLVVVMTYKDGFVYYQDPKISKLGSMSLSDFVSLAKKASELEEGEKVINVISW